MRIFEQLLRESFARKFVLRFFCDFCADLNSQPTSALREKIWRGVFATLRIFEQVLPERLARKIVWGVFATFALILIANPRALCARKFTEVFGDFSWTLIDIGRALCAKSFCEVLLRLLRGF